MSYQVIARKWRPQTFEEVTGQEHITQTLRNALTHDRLHHAYLFSGARGVGKTTTARLLAKALNCHKTQIPNLAPCRTDDPTACSGCLEIAESRSMDVLEIDAASHTGIDDVRETILENININPVRDRYKVFIIDEVHQLSKPAFNALLKTLEEPPQNVVFVMATTELHKVPETIRSRCQEFDFRTISLQKILERLRIIAKAEKIDVDDAALREIARSGMGSMRDAQSNFDQVISFSGERIRSEDVCGALGLASTDMMKEVLDAISTSTPKKILDVVAELISRGQDMRNFSRDLLAVIRDLMVYKVSGGDASLVETSALSPEEIAEYSERFQEADFIRFFNSVCETETALKEAVQPRYVLETGLVKLTEMRRIAPVEQLLERLARLEEALGRGEIDLTTEKADAAAASEKKTLISEPAVPEPEFAPFSPSEPPAEVTPEPLPRVPAAFTVDLSFVESLPVRLAPMDPDDLQHVEDAWLDSAYDRKLERSGDDLGPIAHAGQFVESIVGRSEREVLPGTSSNGSAATAAAPALSAVFTPPDLDDKEADSALPSALPADATEEQLLAYAAGHPLTKKAMRIFRAKIVEVKRA